MYSDMCCLVELFRKGARSLLWLLYCGACKMLSLRRWQIAELRALYYTATCKTLSLIYGWWVADCESCVRCVEEACIRIVLTN
jgi:hypothetical protein